jgi:FlaA1/EpsC-like NDP-sugar epimerase
MRTHAISSIYHAAAYKHVPMMEAHVFEAVRNNIIGTWNLVRAAQKYYASSFLMISSDKAVNPTSVMGVTKRIAELIVSAASNGPGNGTKFVSVRFGNVLGSNGSVVPIFQAQIAAGGPVTVTDPEMRRYFMSIREAVQLVLQASTMGNGSEIFVLDMGEPVKLVDMARNVIRGSGLVPDKDIQIKFIGLRPGEKLHEELVGPGETVQTTGAEKIVKIRPAFHVHSDKLLDRIIEMEKLAIQGAPKELLELLCEIVPNFRPIGLSVETDEQHGMVESVAKMSDVSKVTPLITVTQAKRSGRG